MGVYRFKYLEFVNLLLIFLDYKLQSEMILADMIITSSLVI